MGLHRVEHDGAHLSLVAGDTYRLVSEEFATGDSGDPWRDSSLVRLYNRQLAQITASVWGGWPWTRRTAFPSGGTTSARTTGA